MMPDKRALKILFETYWTAAGWRPENDRQPTPIDFAYAKAAGVMFDPTPVPHEQAARDLATIASELPSRRVADAFVASLSTRRLELRSALGSYAVFRHMPLHPLPAPKQRCDLCGRFETDRGAEDLNVLNFERFKWGGVRHTDVAYGRLDLGLFRTADVPASTGADVATLRAILGAIDESPAGTTSAKLQANLAGLFPSNKSERDVLIGILGYCGVLGTKQHPGFRSRFVPWRDRTLPDRHFVDMAYPACWWTRADGVSASAVHEFFGHLL